MLGDPENLGIKKTTQNQTDDPLIVRQEDKLLCSRHSNKTALVSCLSDSHARVINEETLAFVVGQQKRTCVCCSVL